MTKPRWQVRACGEGPFVRTVLPIEPKFDLPNARHLTTLRDRYDLLSNAGSGDDFDRARRLKSWVRSRWDHGYSSCQPQDDALKFLGRAAEGSQFNCGVYAQVFVECCLAIGLTARRIGLSIEASDYPFGRKGNHGHQVAEVFCKELCKWIIFDIDVNCHFKIDNQPCGAIDLHKAWHHSRGEGVDRVCDTPAFVRPVSVPSLSVAEQRKIWRDFDRHRTLDFYHYLYTWQRHGKPRRSDNLFLFFGGIAHPPLARDFQPWVIEKTNLITSETEFNWPVDQTYARASLLQGGGGRSVRLEFDHSMHAFSHFEVSVDKKRFRRIDGKDQTLNLRRPKTSVVACCVDEFDRRGVPAVLTLSMRSLKHG